MLIDIPEYRDTKVPPLLPKQTEVENIKKSLSSIGGFPDRQIYIISGQNATREGITEALTNAVENAKSKPNARFLLFFRGRSLKIQGINYYLPYDARTGAISTYIEETEFERWLSQTQIKKSFIQVSWDINEQDSKGYNSQFADILNDDQTDSDGDRNITLAEIETKYGKNLVRISGNRSNVIIRLTSTFVVNTQPPGAAVILDGEEKGKSPVKITNLTIGKHQIIVKKDLYRIPEEKTIDITINRGQLYSIQSYQLVPIKIYGIVKFPDGKFDPNIDVRIADTDYHQKIAADGSFSFSDWQTYGMLESGKTYNLIVQNSNGTYTGRISLKYSGTEDIKLDVPLTEKDWIESLDHLMKTGERSAAMDFLDFMISSYEKGESNLLINDVSSRMPIAIAQLISKDVENKILSKPDNVRLLFLAAKLAERNKDADKAKTYWLAVKKNALKSSNEYKQAVERLKEFSPERKPLILLLIIVIIIAGGAIVFYIVRKKRRLIEYGDIPNPYIAGKPISDQNMFFGRDDVFNFIKDKLSRSAKDITIVLHGGRRTGKTSIMYQIASGRLGKDFVPVFIDMQEMAGVDAYGFFRIIAQKVIIEVQKSIINLSEDELKTLDELYQRLDDKTVSAYQNFNSLMNYVSSKLSDKYLIFLIDEYEILERKVAEGDLTSEIFTYLRHLMQNINNLIFIFSGSQTFDKRQLREWSLMFNMAHTREISFLNREDAIALITKPVQEYIKYDKKAIDRLLRLTAGQPFFTQALCIHIVENLNDKKQNKVAVADVDTACRDLVENAPYQFSYIWSELSSDEKIVIALLAETLISEESYAVIDDILSKLPKYDLQYSRNDIGKALAQLQEKDLLEKKPDSELYRFRMELTHAWIQTEHPTWGVLREVQED